MNESTAATPALNSPSPPFFPAPGADQLMHMVLALAAELSAVTEELDTLRQVMLQKGVTTSGELAAFAPSAPVLAARAARRDELVRAMFASLEAESEALAKAAAQGSPGRPAGTAAGAPK